MQRPDRDATLQTIREFDQIGREAFMRKYGFADQNIIYEVEHEGRRYPSKAIFGAAFGKMPGDTPRDSRSCNGTAARMHLDKIGFTIIDSTSPDAPTPIWIVTARWGNDDGVQRFVDRGEWSLLTDTGSANNERMRQMQPGDRIVMRDYFHQSQGLPFEANGARISAIRIRAVGTVTEQRGDGLSVGVDWETPLPEPRVWYFYTQNDPVWRLKDPGESPLADRLRAFILHGAEQDYAYFLKRWSGGDDPSENGAAPMPSPTNLILYGPPGTGKTYATAREAVRLCGEAVPEDREALMALYRSLHHKGRIGFVTFHQNFAYEDFVEGLRPVTGGASEGAASGFTLEAQDGIFKQMAEIAASNHGRAVTAPPALDRSGKVFKMSLGRSWASEDDVIYQDAIRDGYVTLGWGGDIDWSDPRYDDWDAIKLRWRQDHPDASGNDPNMSQMYTFRINMEIGSLVVISDGNRKFRAIGQIAGPYEYRPGHNGEYNHYRRVRWLWHGESLPRERIYDKELSQVSAYQMNGRNLNWDGIEQTVASGGDAVATSGEPEPHVLIIDEINRANISKVFGELITLLEPDKRLGMPNALTVRLPYSKTEFGVPANLHIIGTMNTADRSIALLDTALRRRFSFREMAPEPQLLAAAGGIDLRRVLTTINERIEYLVDREHRIGHAFFIHCRSRDDVNAVMRDKVIPLLQEYFFDDWSRIAAVVGPGFIKRTELKAPPGFGDLPPRPKWAVRADFAANAYDDLVGGKEVTAIDTEGEDEREDAPA